MTGEAGDPWDCDAYGPGARERGALCFLSGALNARVCDSQATCHEAMGGERQRVFRRISELAAEGDPTGAYLADVFASPDQLLGGEDAGDG